MPPPTTPQQLPFEEQLKVYLAVKDNPELYKSSVLNGLIEPWKINFYLSQQAFKTSDPDTIKMKEQAIKLAPREEPVLITGESGTGKELIAQILHGERRGNFVAVNASAVTETLFESELFGHLRGSFTGADRDRDGLIKQTEGERGEIGTLFLDEIGDLPIQMQPKMLRVIQNRVYRRVGSNKDEPVRCRIIAATHRDLRAMIADKSFRLDLYERLDVFHLSLKALRERWKDIELFVNGELLVYLNNLKEEVGTDSYKLFGGNIRQLLNLRLRYEVFGVESIRKEDIL